MMPKDFKDIFFSRRNVYFSLCVISALCISVSAQDFKTVHAGVEYAEVTRKIGDDPVKINLLRLDLKKVRLDVHHALDAAIGTEKTSSLATRHGAVAAINAGFFRLDKSVFAGDAVGTLMIDGELLSESTHDRIALRMFNQRKVSTVSIERTVINAWFGFGVLHSQVKLSGINRERKENELVLFGPQFGRTTLTSEKGADIVLTKCQRVSKDKFLSIECKNSEILNDVSNSTIPVDGYVICLGSGDTKEKKLLLYDLNLYRTEKTKNKSFYLKFENKSSYVSKIDEDVIAGVPQLIKNGQIDITWEQEKSSKAFVETRHPRTAAAKLKDGKFLMITVDGRQPSVSVGMNLNELAAYLLELGAVDAMNLDGGGSTTMFLEGKVVNKPSDKDGERKVSDAILVNLRKKR